VKVHHLRSDAPVEMSAERGLKRKGKSMTTVERLTIADESGHAGTLREYLDGAGEGMQKSHNSDILHSGLNKARTVSAHTRVVGGKLVPVEEHTDKRDAAKEKQAATARAKAFKAWFGKSQVVDREGAPKRTYPLKPTVVYHGSGKRFEAFEQKPSKRGLGFMEYDVQTSVFFFSESLEDAQQFGSQVYACFLKLQDPLVSRMWTGKKWANYFADYDDAKYILEPLIEKGTGGTYIHTTEIDEKSMADGSWVRKCLGDSGGLKWFALDNPEVCKRMKARGYDGTIVDEPDLESGFSWAVLDPTQIKSVDNEGSFDPHNPSIFKGIRADLTQQLRNATHRAAQP